MQYSQEIVDQIYILRHTYLVTRCQTKGSPTKHDSSLVTLSCVDKALLQWPQSFRPVLIFRLSQQFMLEINITKNCALLQSQGFFGVQGWSYSCENARSHYRVFAGLGIFEMFYVKAIFFLTILHILFQNRLGEWNQLSKPIATTQAKLTQPRVVL